MTGRGLVGRRTARFILLATIAMDGFLALLLLTPPNTMGGQSFAPGLWPVSLVPALGAALHLVGLVWMIRILRADPEGGRSSWRAFRRG